MDSCMDARLWIAVAAGVVFAASAFPGISAGLESYTPGHLALLRFLVASLALAIYAALPLSYATAAYAFSRLPASRAVTLESLIPRPPSSSFSSGSGRYPLCSPCGVEL